MCKVNSKGEREDGLFGWSKNNQDEKSRTKKKRKKKISSPVLVLAFLAFWLANAASAGILRGAANRASQDAMHPKSGKVLIELGLVSV